MDISAQTRTESANSLTKEEFDKLYILPAFSTVVLSGYVVQFETPTTIHETDFRQCFELIRLTSAASYKSSSRGWSSSAKQAEMKDPDMKYLLVRAAPGCTEPISIDHGTLDPGSSGGAILGFLSFMVTIEDGFEVVYCYEIHLLDLVRGKGIGKCLMQMLESIGRALRLEKTMLTVFTSNEYAIKFYQGLGYEIYDEEPAPPQKRLRGRLLKKPKPSYVIMAIDLII